MTLTGKTALITGSTSGIGLGIARALAAQGAAIMLNGLGDRDEIELMRRRMAQDFNTAIFYHPADLSQANECERLVKDAQEALGAVDILVNNAGIQFVAPVEDFPIDRWDMILAVNLSSAFHTIRTSLPRMKRQGWGRIINIASAHGLVASAEKSAYVASKHGLIGLTKSVALETAQSGVTCNAICPGWVLTPLVQNQIEARAKASGKTILEEEQALLREKQPSGRFTKVEELGALAAFLCSDGAGNMTGASLSMDGGWTVH